tara:strand:- start:7370 stop:7666 length:297 start_codon:yes stop_codon:yes gene_type:complete
MKKYYIYILSNASKMLYVGLSTDLDQIIIKHREKRMFSFKANFSFDKLIYVEETTDVYKAIDREEEIKKIPRHRKMDLLRLTNPKLECISRYWVKETA